MKLHALFPLTHPAKRMQMTFREAYQRATGYELATPWSAFNTMLKAKFETADIFTGEELKEYPSAEVWEREVRGFFLSEYPRQQGFPLTLFMSQYGQYSSKVPRPKEVVLAQLAKWDTCDTCGRDYPQGSICSHCTKENHNG